VPKAGLVYKPAPTVALYANTVSGFQANPLLGQNGQPLPPALSRQVEAGARFDLFDQRARLDLAWYRITLDHSVDLVSPQPPYFATPGPGQTNHGLEIQLAGELAPGLDATASYTDARIRNDDGSPATAAPRRLFSAWASYRFQRAPLQAWSVGAGIVAQSRSLGRSSDGGAYFAVPGQASAELNVAYHAADWRLALGVRNLFARTLYALDFDETFVPVREGRTAMLSGSYDF
jgi:iron complex outermembrane receptor protein